MQLIDMLEHGSIIWLCVLLFILHLVADRVVRQCDSDVRLWGLRMGLAAFLLWLLRQVLRNGFVADALAGAALRGLIVAGLAVNITWLVLPVGRVLTRHFISRFWKDRQAKSHQALEPNRRQPEEQERRLISPAQEQAERERRQQCEQEERQRRADQSRRHALEYELRLFYDQFRLELKERFPQEQFESYFKTFLTDATPVNIYEQRAEQLKNMLRDRLELPQRDNQPEFHSIEDILRHFHGQMEQMHHIEGLDPDTLDTLLCTLEEAQDHAIKEFLS